MATVEQAEQPTQSTTGIERSRGRGMHPLVWILLAGMIVRLGLWMVWAEAPVRVVDAQDYNHLALGLLERGEFVDQHGRLTSLRPPLYPAMIAAIYRVFGSENYAAVRAVQSLLSLLTVVCVYILGREVYSRRVGLWAAAGVCFYPSLLGFNNLLLSETVFTLFVVAITLAVVLAVRRESVGLLALAGVLIGLGALVRSILWLFGPLLSVYLFVVWRGGRRRRFLVAAVPLALFAIALAPWSYRNTKLHDTFTVVDVMGGRNAMMGNYEHTPLERSWATISIVKGENEWHRVLAKETPHYSELTQGQIDKAAMRHGMKFALSHPGLTIKRDLVRFFNFWQLERTLVAGGVKGTFGDVPKMLLLPAAVLICGSYAAVMFAAIFGLFFRTPDDRRLHGLLVMTVVFPCVIHSLIFAHSRYHLPIVPVLMLYAVAAALNWKVIWSQRRTKRFVLAASLCVVLVLGWLRELIFVDLSQMSGIVG